MRRVVVVGDVNRAGISGLIVDFKVVLGVWAVGLDVVLWIVELRVVLVGLVYGLVVLVVVDVIVDGHVGISCGCCGWFFS